MNPKNFFAELKRRNVYKVAVAYAVVGWLIIQIASTILPTFHAPEWVLQSLVVIVALLIYSWLGEKDLALEQLAISAKIPAGVFYGELKLSPLWDSLRGDARLEKILNSLAPK